MNVGGAKAKSRLTNMLEIARRKWSQWRLMQAGGRERPPHLFDSEKYFRDFMEDSIDIVHCIGLEGNFRFVNRKWRQLLGYDETDIAVLSLSDIIHSGYPAYDKELFNRIISGEYIHDIETVLLTKNGNKIIVEGNSRPYQVDGERIGALGFFRDITQRKEAEKALRESERRLELALESAGLGLWDHDLVTDKVIRNERWAEMLGFRLEEIDSEANTWRNLIHPDDAALVKKIAEEHEAGRTPFFKAEHRLRSKSGEWKWILNWGKVVERDKNGRPLRATGTHLDITERKQEEEIRLNLEAQVQQAQKFKSLNLMAGSIAHHFNNLLMVILGNLELASSSLGVASPIKPGLENAEKAAKRAAELSSLMLTYSGHHKSDMQVLNLSAVVEEMFEMLKLTASNKTELLFQPCTRPVFFKGDPAQIRQAVMNLVINAAEAVGDDKGTIKLSTGTLFCDRSSFQPPFHDENLPEGEYTYLEVSDTGCGIDKETLAKVFDPFFTTKFQGRGLGMAVVLGIVRAHQGTVLLNSQPGMGTTVKMLFQVLKDHEKYHEKKPLASPQDHMQGMVLLIDDDENVLDVGKRMLERLGFQVLAASNAFEAIDIFKQQFYKIPYVFINLSMPRMNGVELFHKLREIKKDILVIITSGYPEKQVMSQFNDIRPDGFIQKPFLLNELETKIRTILRKAT